MGADMMQLLSFAVSPFVLPLAGGLVVYALVLAIRDHYRP
jgi:hypothetical protein